MRHLIDILSPSRTPDEAGGAAVSWALVETVWARVERLAGSRDFAGDRTNRLRRIAATIRFRSDVGLGQRIDDQGVRYEIVSIEAPDGPDRYLVLVAEEVLP